MDRLVIESTLGRGTRIEMWKWVPARVVMRIEGMNMHQNGRLGPIEWAIAGRRLPGEHVSGDQPIAVGIDTDAALFGVIDGLGHGPDAATAAIRAVEVLKEPATSGWKSWCSSATAY